MIDLRIGQFRSPRGKRRRKVRGRGGIASTKGFSFLCDDCPDIFRRTCPSSGSSRSLRAPRVRLARKRRTPRGSMCARATFTKARRLRPPAFILPVFSFNYNIFIQLQCSSLSLSLSSLASAWEIAKRIRNRRVAFLAQISRRKSSRVTSALSSFSRSPRREFPILNRNFRRFVSFVETGRVYRTDAFSVTIQTTANILVSFLASLLTYLSLVLSLYVESSDSRRKHATYLAGVAISLNNKRSRRGLIASGGRQPAKKKAGNGEGEERERERRD